MTSQQQSPFERPFAAGDEHLFRELTRGLVAAECVRWRETYANGLVFDFGRLIPVAKPRSERLPKERGEWVASSWGCDILISDEARGRAASSEEDFEAIKGLARDLVGSRVTAVAVTPGDLSLVMEFANRMRLNFQTDTSDPEVDQWFIQLPSKYSVGASAAGRWYLREDS